MDRVHSVDPNPELSGQGWLLKKENYKLKVEE